MSFLVILTSLLMLGTGDSASIAVCLLTAQAVPPATTILDENDRNAEIQKKSSEWMIMSEEARKAEDSGAYADAIAKYQDIMQDRQRLGLDLVNELNALAGAYEKSGQLPEAEDSLKKAIELREKDGGDDDPTTIFPLRSYVEFLQRNGRAEDAKEQLKRIDYIESQRNQPPSELVVLTAKSGLDSEERSKLATAIGDRYIKRDQEARAILAFDKAIEWNPKNAAAYAGRGEARRRLEQDAFAKRDLDKAIELDPQNVRALFTRAMHYEGIKRYAAALADFDQAIEANPEDVEIIGYRAKLYQNTKRPKLAILDYTRILAIAPKTTWAQVQRGLSYTDTNELDKALADFNALAQRYPENSEYVRLRDDLLKRMQAKTRASK